MTDVLRLPATVSATRRARPGCEEQLDAWAAMLCAEAAHTHGHLDSRVERRAGGAVTVSVTFDSAAALAGWEAAPRRAACLALADGLTDGAPAPAAAVGAPVPAAPPRWRTALVVWAGLFPFSLLFAATAAPALTGLPVVVQSLVSSVVLVPLAVYVGIPVVNAGLARRRR